MSGTAGGGGGGRNSQLSPEPEAGVWILSEFAYYIKSRQPNCETGYWRRG